MIQRAAQLIVEVVHDIGGGQAGVAVQIRLTHGDHGRQRQRPVLLRHGALCRHGAVGGLRRHAVRQGHKGLTGLDQLAGALAEVLHGHIQRQIRRLRAVDVHLDGGLEHLSTQQPVAGSHSALSGHGHLVQAAVGVDHGEDIRQRQAAVQHLVEQGAKVSLAADAGFRLIELVAAAQRDAARAGIPQNVFAQLRYGAGGKVGTQPQTQHDAGNLAVILHRQEIDAGVAHLAVGAGDEVLYVLVRHIHSGAGDGIHAAHEQGLDLLCAEGVRAVAALNRYGLAADGVVIAIAASCRSGQNDLRVLHGDGLIRLAVDLHREALGRIGNDSLSVAVHGLTGGEAGDIAGLLIEVRAEVGGNRRGLTLELRPQAVRQRVQLGHIRIRQRIAHAVCLAAALLHALGEDGDSRLHLVGSRCGHDHGTAQVSRRRIGRGLARRRRQQRREVGQRDRRIDLSVDAGGQGARAGAQQALQQGDDVIQLGDIVGTVPTADLNGADGVALRLGVGGLIQILVQRCHLAADGLILVVAVEIGQTVGLRRTVRLDVRQQQQLIGVVIDAVVAHIGQRVHRLLLQRRTTGSGPVADQRVQHVDVHLRQGTGLIHQLLHGRLVAGSVRHQRIGQIHGFQHIQTVHIAVQIQLIRDLHAVKRAVDRDLVAIGAQRQLLLLTAQSAAHEGDGAGQPEQRRAVGLIARGVRSRLHGVASAARCRDLYDIVARTGHTHADGLSVQLQRAALQQRPGHGVHLAGSRIGHQRAVGQGRLGLIQRSGKHGVAHHPVYLVLLVYRTVQRILIGLLLAAVGRQRHIVAVGNGLVAVAGVQRVVLGGICNGIFRVCIQLRTYRIGGGAVIIGGVDIGIHPVRPFGQGSPLDAGISNGLFHIGQRHAGGQVQHHRIAVHRGQRGVVLLARGDDIGDHLHRQVLTVHVGRNGGRQRPYLLLQRHSGMAVGAALGGIRQRIQLRELLGRQAGRLGVQAEQAPVIIGDGVLDRLHILIQAHQYIGHHAGDQIRGGIHAGQLRTVGSIRRQIILQRPCLVRAQRLDDRIIGIQRVQKALTRCGVQQILQLAGRVLVRFHQRHQIEGAVVRRLLALGLQIRGSLTGGLGEDIGAVLLRLSDGHQLVHKAVRVVKVVDLALDGVHVLQRLRHQIGLLQQIALLRLGDGDAGAVRHLHGVGVARVGEAALTVGQGHILPGGSAGAIVIDHSRGHRHPGIAALGDARRPDGALVAIHGDLAAVAGRRVGDRLIPQQQSGVQQRLLCIRQLAVIRLCQQRACGNGLALARVHRPVNGRRPALQCAAQRHDCGQRQRQQASADPLPLVHTVPHSYLSSLHTQLF